MSDTARSNSSHRSAVFALTILAASAPLAAAERGATSNAQASRSESAGVASGLAIGAAAGGPFGAIFGAAAGAWLGDRYHRQNVARSRVESDLANVRGEYRRSIEQLADAQRNDAQMRKALNSAEALGARVLFRTGEATLREEERDVLLRIAALASELPEAKLQVAGYADPRGAAQFNMQLSERRAATVIAALEEAGVARDRIALAALGETAATAAEADVDGNAFERRVEITLVRDGRIAGNRLW
jgi:outer membrane protein OmpA-like peptidoglycan-associated protein